jgi:tetratricopeptide (TPR) repeat protein
MKGDLKKAERLYRGGKYPKVIRLLEPQIFRFRQSYDFFYLAGMSCLRTGDLGGASTYLQRGLGLKPQDANAHLGLALVHLGRQEIQEAIRCYLEVMDNDPNNRFAKRGLTLLKKDASAERIADSLESGRFARLSPGRKRLPLWAVAIISVIVVALGTSAVLLAYTDVFDRTVIHREPTIAAMTLRDVGDLVDLNGQYRFLLTAGQIESTFAAVKDHFANFRDNLARREINRLLGSNASQKVKEQARTVDSYLSIPDFTTIRDSFEYDAVLANPYLYDRTHVVWGGKIADLARSADRITFNLLVGYETNEVLLGIVGVILEFSADLDPGDAVEVLGQVHVDQTGGLYLTATSIHKLIQGVDS